MNPFDTSTTLLTSRFVLKPIVDSDIEFVYQGLSHPEVIKYYGISYNSLEGTRDQRSGTGTLYDDAYPLAA